MLPFKSRISSSFIGILYGSVAFGQCLFIDSQPPAQLLGGGSGGTNYETRNGWYLPTKDTIRILMVLVEVDYAVDTLDPTPPGGFVEWPSHSLPIWVNNPDPDVNIADWNPPVGTATGLLTRYFQDASSNHYTVLSDYLLAPDNGGIFHTTAGGQVTQ